MVCLRVCLSGTSQMNESSSVRIDRKARRKITSYFSTDSPEALFVKSQSSATTPDPSESERKLEKVPSDMEDPKIDEEEEDQTINLQGMDIDKLALDGTLAMTALNDVLQKIGIDVSASGESSKKKSRKQMSPLEIKCNVQTQIIIQLGR